MFENQNTLELLAKHAYNTSVSKKPSDIIVAMMKLAQNDEIYDEIFSLPEKRIKSILSEPGKYEYKKDDIRKALQNSLSAISGYVMSKAKNDEVASAVAELMPVAFVDKSVERLEEFNGAKAKDFSLKGLSNGALNTANDLVAIREKRNLYQGGTENRTLKPIPASLDVKLKGGKGDGNQTFQDFIKDESSAGAFEGIYQQGSEGGLDDKAASLDSIINKILDDPEQDILSLYVENKIIPQFNNLKKRLSTNNPQERASAEADLDLFYENFFKYVSDNIGQQKRIYDQGGGRREYSLQQVQEYVNDQLKELDLDNVLEYVFKQNFYNLPKWAKKAEPSLVKQVLKSIIKSSLIFSAKSAMDVSLPSAETRGQGGSAQLSQIELVHHILKKEIRKIAQDEGEQQKLISEALKLLGSKIDKETGKVVHKTKDALSYSLFQHATPALMSALMQKSMEVYGERFADLSPDEQEALINEVQSKVYTKARMPYTQDVGGYELKTTPYHALENAESISRENIRERLQQAMDIKGGRALPGGFMKKRVERVPLPPPTNYDFNSDLDDLDDDFGKESALSYMIKKYALKH
jgi:hypothetical protein